jgi:hypothetical protein
MINNDLWHGLLRTGGKKEVKGLHSNQSEKNKGYTEQLLGWPDAQKMLRYTVQAGGLTK